MHIDLNSCFASIEQQAYPNLRGKPIVVAAYATDNGCVLAASIEAKRFGIKTGMMVRDAKRLYKSLIVRDPDPQMVRAAHIQFRRVLEGYSSKVIPQSIDEWIIDFNGTPHLEKGLVQTGKEIKQQILKRVGDHLLCNIGISTNRFLAKLAASLHKPDGLDIIDSTNLLSVYSQLKLTDLNGIASGYERQLNLHHIFTPLEFFDASSERLEHVVFRSIIGNQWYRKLRGWETDDREFLRKSFGQSYALQKKTKDRPEVCRILMKLCEKMGRRLRHSTFRAYGVSFYCSYTDDTSFHTSKTFSYSLYTTLELFEKIISLLDQQPQWKVISHIAVSCFDLRPQTSTQLQLFDASSERLRGVQRAVDSVNDRWGEFSVTSALMMNMKGTILDRIAFGRIRELEDKSVYNQSDATN